MPEIDIACLRCFSNVRANRAVKTFACPHCSAVINQPAESAASSEFEIPDNEWRANVLDHVQEIRRKDALYESVMDGRNKGADAHIPFFIPSVD